MCFYEIALSLVPGIGNVLGKKLISYCGNAEAVFHQNKKLTKKIPRVGEKVLEILSGKDILIRAEEEMKFISRYGIKALTFQDPEYPSRLNHCLDSPLILYARGNAGLNPKRVVGVVGTRTPTDYGKETCRRLIEGLVEQKVLVVSGLAYGIDTCAHRSSLDNGLMTAAVLGHGLDRIYPWLNKSLAEKIIRSGALLTDFPNKTLPDKENFPKRNRIIAGMSDAVLVIEAAQKGGALITAELANSYNRDVFAVPGRIGDPFSEGTNTLIRTNKAALIQSAEDVISLMGWEPGRKAPQAIQRKIFLEMTDDERKLVDILSGTEKIGIDDLTLRASMRMSVVSAALLNLEFEGIVKSMPGKVYSLA